VIEIRHTYRILDGELKGGLAIDVIIVLKWVLKKQ
jgi:hypothetical protein